MGKKGDKSKNINNKLVKEKDKENNIQQTIFRNKDFQERISYLDTFSSGSELSQSTFAGMFNMLVTLGLVHFTLISIVNYK